MNNSKTEITNGEMTVQDEILYREILEEEVVDDQIIQTYDEIFQLNVVNGDIGQGPIKEVNKEVKEIKNEDCYEMHNGEFFKIDPVQNEILYNEIIQSYNGNINDWLMDFGDAEDEIDIKIIEEYNRLILEKKLHTSK